MRTMWALVWASTLIGLVACTGGHQAPEHGAGPPTSVSDVLARAVAATKEAGTAQVSQVLRTITTTPGSTDRSTVTSLGEVDFRSGVGEMDQPGGAGGSKSSRVIFAPGAVYEPAAGLGVPLPQGKSWYVILFSRDESANVAVLDAVSGGPGSPGDMLSLLAVGTGVRRLGNLSIRGVDSAGYAFVVPPSVFQRLASAAPALYHSVRQGTSPVPVRVWIDGHDLVRRVLVDDTQLEGGTSPGSANVQMHIFTETDFFDFGVPVNVTVPPASEVLTLRQLIRAMAADVPKRCRRIGAGGQSPSSLGSVDCPLIISPPGP